jgi:hypothetical protein
MKASARNKSDRMLAADERKLGRLVEPMLQSLGFTRNPDSDSAYAYGEWTIRVDDRTTLRVCPIIDDQDGHPWLACRFDRPYPRPDLPWDAPENRRIFRDLAERYDANPHSGKCNIHVFTRVTAADALDSFRRHLVSIARLDMRPGPAAATPGGVQLSMFS